MHPPLSQKRSNRTALAEPGHSNWYWQIGRAPGHEHCVRALLDGTGAGSKGINRAQIQMVKKGHDYQLPDGESFAAFVYGQLLEAIQTDPVCANAHWWTAYPSHDGGSAMLPLLSRHLSGPLAESSYLGHLFLRHIPAIKAAYARRRGESVSILNQCNTAHLNPEYRHHLKGKRILVLDDYTTAGYSFEWATMLLLEAGAAGVVCVALAKCGLSYHPHELNPARSWSPFRPVTFGDADLSSRVLTAPPTCAALQRFRQRLTPHQSPR